MHRALVILIAICLLGAALPSSIEAANPYSISFVAGGGLPVGWWGDRWGLMHSGELTFRYRIDERVGFFIFTGINKTYYVERSEEKIADDSRAGDSSPEYEPYTTITDASEGGAFKQIPVGTGFYGETSISGVRTYGSAAFVVNLWKFERGQVFEERITPPASDTIYHSDSWSDQQDGSNVGLQFAAGILYPLRKGMLLDASLAYHFTGVSKDNMAIAYWGKPARTWSAEQKSEAKNHADFIALRLGIRFGN